MTDPILKIAVRVDPARPLGLVANSVATTAMGLGAAQPLFGNTPLTDAAGRSVRNRADRPVPILQAPVEVIRELLLKAAPTPESAFVIPFPRHARQRHAFADHQAEFPRRDLTTEIMDGIGLAGPERWIKSLTGGLKLLR